MVDEHKSRLRTAIKMYGHYRFRLGMESVQSGAAAKRRILNRKLEKQEQQIEQYMNELEYAAVHVYEKGLD